MDTPLRITMRGHTLGQWAALSPWGPLAACLTTQPAADFRICNVTRSRRYRARLQRRRGLGNQGWWNVTAGNCETLLRGNLAYASTISTRSTMIVAANGRAKPSCARATGIYHPGHRRLPRRGFERTGFPKSMPVSSRPGRTVDRDWRSGPAAGWCRQTPVPAPEHGRCSRCLGRKSCTMRRQRRTRSSRLLVRVRRSCRHGGAVRCEAMCSHQHDPPHPSECASLCASSATSSGSTADRWRLSIYRGRNYVSAHSKTMLSCWRRVQTSCSTPIRRRGTASGHLPHPEILTALKPGHTLLLDDGRSTGVLEASRRRRGARVEVGGKLSARKSACPIRCWDFPH